MSDEQREAAEAVGDIDEGEGLFNKANTEMPDDVACSTCHTTNGTVTPWAPTLAGVYGRAGLRVDGLSDVDYLRQSIVDPYAFLVDGEWTFAMPLGFADVLTQEQIDNLIAFIMTL